MQATDSWVGRKLGGRYQILEVIGEGGMGIVYRAKQLSVDREVAIKMMHTRAAQDPKWSERFQSEAKACSLLTHPNTIRLYDFGKTTLGNFYMVMELLTGKPLTNVIDEQAPIAPARVLRILMQCCASLAEAHNAGIIHRDIKPDNIFVQKLQGADDFIKLFDFSIAKRTDVQMTATGIIMGTPQFMSPEQGRGLTIDARSDLYSLGIVAYAMLTGRLPFHDEDPLEVLRMHQVMEVPPLPASIPNSVAMLVMSCLDKNATRRPATAMALLEACKIWLTELDPTLDVASDPILKNTLVSGGPTVEVQNKATLSGTPTPTGIAKTMLDSSGGVGSVVDSAHTPAPAPAPTPTPAHTDAPDDLNDSNQPLIHGARADSDSDTRRTSIQSPSGPQRSDSEEIRLDQQLRTRQPTNQPTVNNFSTPTVSRKAPGHDSGAQQVNQPPATGAVPLAPAPVAAALEPAHQEYGAEFDGEPIAMPSGRGGFLFACLLVALTFGFGAYYLTATLR